MKFEWNISQDSPHCSSATNSKSSCQKWAKSQKNLHDGVSSCRCSTTSHGDLKTMNRNAMLTPSSLLFVREKFHQEDGHSSDLDQKRSGILLMKANHKDNGTGLRSKWWKIFAESGHPVFRSTSGILFVLDHHINVLHSPFTVVKKSVFRVGQRNTALVVWWSSGEHRTECLVRLSCLIWWSATKNSLTGIWNEREARRNEWETRYWLTSKRSLFFGCWSWRKGTSWRDPLTLNPWLWRANRLNHNGWSSESFAAANECFDELERCTSSPVGQSAENRTRSCRNAWSNHYRAGSFTTTTDEKDAFWPERLEKADIVLSREDGRSRETLQ